MKLASFIVSNSESYGKIVDGGVLDLGPALKPEFPDLASLLPHVARAESVKGGPIFAFSEVEFLPVIPRPQKIFGIGLNYQSHIDETKKQRPNFPMVFTRFADTQVGHLQPLVRPKETQRFDYQGTLAVIIGKPGRRIPRDVALSYVGGYACYNDASVRDWQRHTDQFTSGKNFPASGGFGPWLTTIDEIPDPAKLTIITRHNGEVVQEESAGNMLIDVPSLIEYCSTFTPLSPGDVIVTGTPGGVGALYQPPRWLICGVTVDVEIEGIGTLTNPVEDE